MTRIAALLSRSCPPPAVLLFCALSTGILLGRVLPDMGVRSFFIILPILTGSTILLLITLKLPPAAGVSLLCLTWGFFSIQSILYPEMPASHILNETHGQRLTITGKVSGFVRHFADRSKIKVRCQAINLKDDTKKPVTGTILLTLYGKQDSVRCGDTIRFEAKLRPFRNFSNPNGFDYISHMKLRQIDAAGYTDLGKFQVLPRDKLPWYQRTLQNIESHRVRFHQLILARTDAAAPESGSILTALITGKKEWVAASVRDTFSRTGISHLLAISGLHLSIVALSFSLMFHRLISWLFPVLQIKGYARSFAWFLAIIPVTFYALFSGFSPSTQRAYLMIAVFLISLIFQKEKDLFSSLCAAGIVILLLDAAALFALSFQLSFSAVLFIIAGMTAFRKKIPVFHSKTAALIFPMVMATVMAGLGTLPLIAGHFHIISHIQILTNLLAVPIVGFVVIPVGFCAFFISQVSFHIAALLIDGCLFLLSATINTAQFLADLPYTWSIVTSVKPQTTLLYYLTAITVYFYLRSSRKAAAAGMISCLAVLVFALTQHITQRETTVTEQGLSVIVLDVGQGNAAVIQSSGNENILIDGGGFSGASGFDTGRMIVAPYLWSQNIRKVSTVILTHPEADHLNGIAYILDHFHVEKLIKNTDSSSGTHYARLMAICRKHNVKVIQLEAYEESSLSDNLKLRFFPPGNPTLLSDANNRSLVIRLAYKNFSMLFPGDILELRERSIIDPFGPLLASDVLLAPHHGSKTSSSKFFLDHVRPKSVIISCGFQNRYGFPHPDVLSRLKQINAELYRTDQHGAVLITTDGRNHTIQTVKGG